MSLISSNSSSDKNIQWQTDSLFDIWSDWNLINATRYDSNIDIKSKGRISLSVNVDNIKAENARLNISVSSSNKDLSTDDTHKVSVIMKFYYTNTENDTLDVDTKTYYPKYVFESTYISGECAVELYSNRELVRIDVTVYNRETDDITIEQITMCLNHTVKDEVAEQLIDAIDGFQELIDKLNGGQLKIPELSESIIKAYENDRTSISDNTLWWSREYESFNGVSASQMLQYIQYQNSIKSAIDADIGLSDGSYILDTFKNEITSNNKLRTEFKNFINSIEDEESDEDSNSNSEVI